MSTTPRSWSSRRRARCNCVGGGGGDRDRATPFCFNPLRSVFRCPSRGHGRSSHRHRTLSKVQDELAAGPEQQIQEPSFYVYAMPNQSVAERKKHKKRRLPSIRSCFCKKKERKANAATSARRHALTPAPSMVTHPRSPPPETAEPAAHSVTLPVSSSNATQPPSPGLTDRKPKTSRPATPKLVKQSTEPARSPPMTPQRQQAKQVEGLEIVEVATGERLSAHEGLIEMVSSVMYDDSAEASVKSSLEYADDPPKPATGPVVMMAMEPLRLWLNGYAAKAGTGERFAEPFVVAEAEELWAHNIACSRVHAAMLTETVSS